MRRQLQTLSGPVSGVARLIARRILPWIGLGVVVASSALGLQGVAAALGPTTSVSAQTDIRNPAADGGSSLPLDGSYSSRRSVVLITAHDSATGDRAQVLCVTDTARIASDTLLADMNDLRDVAAGVCA